MQHHKLNIYTDTNITLLETEKIDKHFFLIGIPFFLNFNFKKLKKCLEECKKSNLI